MGDHTQRFSNRVANYVKFRPGYPKEIIAFFEERIQFNNSFIIADVGSGTGILTKLFLDNGNRVYAVEPNEPMRIAAEAILIGYNYFISINGTAEQTTLPNNSMDLITAAQAFHWFDVDKTKVEFRRILKAGGHCCLIWNERLNKSAFAKAYDELLLNYSTDYANVDHKQINDEKIAAFFAPHQFIKKSFNNKQVFDFEALKGRLLSSSYAPAKGEPKHEEMLAALYNLYKIFNQNNSVQFDYETKVYSGKLY